MKKFLTGLVMIVCVSVMAQDSTEQAMPFSFSVYAEAYYSYDFNKPADHNRPAFIYSHNRHNEFNVNLAFVKGSYSTERVRASIALAAGTYMNANYAAEPGVLKNIYEANAGFKILRNKNLWLDMGIMPSHIGFESAINKDCWTLTRSMLADNSPYYESGAKLSYTTDNGKWLLSAMALNGWQRVQRVPGNSLMSWGTQVQFKPSDKVLLNYSTFAGTDKPDSARLWRYFHNLCGVVQLTDQWGLTVGVDFGWEQETKGNSDLHTWYSPVCIFRFKPNDDWAFALRGEYYSDKNGVIISTGTPNGFKTFGASLNIDRAIGSNFWLRTEIRTLNSKDAIFIRNGNNKDNSTSITTSFALTF